MCKWFTEAMGLPTGSLNLILFQVPVFLVIGSFILLIIVLAIGIYQDPLVNGLGLALFMAGIPLYYLGEWARQQPSVQRFFGKFE